MRRGGAISPGTSPLAKLYEVRALRKLLLGGKGDGGRVPEFLVSFQ